jgi:tRNA_anti-like/GYF domain 2
LAAALPQAVENCEGITMSDVWYYADKNGKVGPLTLQGLKDTLATFPKTAAVDVLVWRTGFPDWKVAREVVELNEQVPPPLPTKSQAAKQKQQRSLYDRQARNADDDAFLKKTLVRIAAVGGLVVFAASYLGQPPSAPARDSAVEKESAPPAKILRYTAQEILDAYEANEVATDNRLKGYIIEISGIVQSIDKNAWDTMYVRLKADNQFNSANMKVDAKDEAKIAALRRGQSVVFRCAKMVRWVGSPTGENCLLTSPST